MESAYEEKKRLKKELKQKKERLFELERLKFDKEETAFSLKEKLRLEVIKLEKEIDGLP